MAGSPRTAVPVRVLLNASRQPLHPVVSRPILFLSRRQTSLSQKCTRQRRSQSTITNQQYGYSQQPPPPPPSRTLLRTIRRLTLYGLGAACFVTLGMYIGWTTFPMKSEVTALLHGPLSDEDSLQYEATDPALAAINERIVNHAVSRALRANPDFVESRPHLKMPSALRKNNLTGGTLAGEGKMSVPPLVFVEKEGRSFVSVFHLGGSLCGHPGLVHGGMLATLLDEGLARCCFPALPNKVAVTASLKVDYRRPVKADEFYVLRARTTRVEGRKAWVTGWIEKLGDEDEEIGEKGVKGIESVEEPSKGQKDSKQKLVEAEALYIEPKNAQVIRRVFPVE